MNGLLGGSWVQGACVPMELVEDAGGITSQCGEVCNLKALQTPMLMGCMEYVLVGRIKNQLLPSHSPISGGRRVRLKSLAFNHDLVLGAIQESLIISKMFLSYYLRIYKHFRSSVPETVGRDQHIFFYCFTVIKEYYEPLYANIST